MKSLLAMVKHRINQSKATSLFFIFGMVISMLLCSIGISFSSELIYAAMNKASKHNNVEMIQYIKIED